MEAEEEDEFILSIYWIKYWQLNLQKKKIWLYKLEVIVFYCQFNFKLSI